MPVHVFSVGEVLSAANVNSWLAPTAVYKTSATTRQSTTTLTADPDLTLTVAANAVYQFQALILCSSGSGQAYKWTLALTGGATGTLNYMWGNVDGWTTLPQTAGASQNVATPAGVGSDRTHLINGIAVITGTGGAVTYQWAQQTSGAFNTVTDTNSYMIMQRIA